MYKRLTPLIVLLIALTGSFFHSPCAYAQSVQSNPGWVSGLGHYVYYLEMPVAQDKAAIAQVETNIKQKAGVISCTAKGWPVEYFVVHTSAPVTNATMQDWALGAGTTLNKVVAHGTRAYQAWQTRPGNSRIERKANH